MQEGGWVRLYRAIRKHWLWEDAIKLKWWIDILLQANHQDRKVLIGNELMNIERGSFHTSIIKLSDRWQVDRKTVKKFLELLEKDGMITLKTSKKGTTLKVSNYEGYQANSEVQIPNKVDNGMDNRMDKGVDNTMDNTMDNSVPIKSQQSGHKQELKNYKNDEEGEERKEGKENTTVLPSVSFPTPRHKFIYETVTENSYKTWFENTTIEESETEIVITAANKLSKNIIESKFLGMLKILTGKKIIVKED